MMMEMNQDLAQVPQQNSHTVEHCPASDNHIVGEEKRDFAIPGAQVTWWHCQTCLGWHVVLIDIETETVNRTSD